MDYNELTLTIYPGADFNSACFNFTEQEARAKKLWRDPRPMPTKAQLEAVEAEKSKENSIAIAYDEMVKDIYAEMYKVFGTTNDVSAQATASTYEAMAKRPANYVGELGLVDEGAVEAYAKSKVAEADAYAIYRLKRIAKFQADRLALTK